MTSQQHIATTDTTAGTSKPILLSVVAASRDYPRTMAAMIAKIIHMQSALDLAFQPSHCRVDESGLWCTCRSDSGWEDLWTFLVPVVDLAPGGEPIH